MGKRRRLGTVGAGAALLLSLGGYSVGCGGDAFTMADSAGGEAGQSEIESTGGQGVAGDTGAAGQQPVGGAGSGTGGATGSGGDDPRGGATGEAGTPHSGGRSGGSGGEPGGGTAGAVGGSPEGGAGGALVTGGSGGAPAGGSGGAAGSGGSPTGGSAGSPTGGSAGSPTGGSAGSPTGGAAGTGGAGSEDCLNGVDDNGDELVDCADPLCAEGFVCVPGPPEGWTGVGWMSAESLAACPDALPATVDLYDAGDLSYSPASCNCACEGISMVECFAELICSSDATCSDTAPGDNLVGEDCTPVALDAPGSASAYCMVGAFRAMGATCDASVAVGMEPASWPLAGRACLTEEGGSCEGAEVCIPLLAPDAVGPCIAHGGNQNCPASYPAKILYHDGSVDDQRACSDCVCAETQPAQCGCNAATECGVNIYNDLQCGSEPQLIRADGSCVPVSGMSNSLAGQLVGASVMADARCGIVSDSEPVGDVVPVGTITLCCME